jgi:hypothetical protein
MYSYSKQYLTAHAKKYYAENREKCLEYGRAYRETHKEEAKAYREKKKLEKNKDAIHVSPSS